MQKITAALIIGCALYAGAPHAGEIENPLKPGGTWTELAADVVGDAVPADGAGLLDVDAPYRAHDAAIVPLRITQVGGSDKRIKKLTVVVDENPAPIVAVFELGTGMGFLDLETRVRVDQYSNIRTIAETDDGQLWMTGRFVKASGGCSAPALKDMESAIAGAGKMRMKLFDVADTGRTSTRKQAQVMIRHPNYSGMQRNQITQLFIPAFFVHELEVFLGDERLFRMEGGISISEDPVFRFAYTPNGSDTFRVRAVDTEGAVYEQTFPANGQQS